MEARRELPARSDEGRRDEDPARLSAEQRAKLGMDSWEPSLLRRLLTAHNELAKQNKQ